MIMREECQTEEKPTHLLHDRDTKFNRHFDGILRSEDVDVRLLPYRSPNLNARCERFVQTIKQECLDHFLVFGERQLNHIVREYVSYYNSERAHSCRDHLPPRQAHPPLENNAADLDGIVFR